MLTSKTFVRSSGVCLPPTPRVSPRPLLPPPALVYVIPNAKFTVNPYDLFIRQSRTTPASPTQHLRDVLTRARSLYGAGMGFSSLSVLASIVRASVGLHWEEESDLADLLAVIDADIGQAIQSSKEEIEGGRVSDFGVAREIVKDLREAVTGSMADVKRWGGEFPFERAASSLECWKI
ncbi:hypothetical protein LshimejAT787_2600070 [Lyophyllum shimeji]|uniref:Uncharacterized protein n=1 Tax=Lyophyllum shimeji TaxID=47721 RepID=A0A9P3Q246_LYOSH|nr:hypothetical protein LshimejAT787_2600070 [Lyophyllum shimeji]